MRDVGDIYLKRHEKDNLYPPPPVVSETGVCAGVKLRSAKDGQTEEGH